MCLVALAGRGPILENVRLAGGEQRVRCLLLGGSECGQIGPERGWNVGSHW